MLQFYKTHWIIFAFCAVYLIFSFSTYKMFPVSNGEEFRYYRGKETLEHFLHGKFTEKMLQPRPHYFIFNAYPMFSVWLNHSFYFEWFHLIDLLFSLPIFILLYAFIFVVTRNKWLGVLGPVLLCLVPPFFGQLPINPIDMPFTLGFLASLAGVYFLTPLNRSYKFLLLGLLFGLTQGMRQIGLSLYFMAIAYELFFYSPRGLGIRSKGGYLIKLGANYLLVFVVANFFMLILWPNFAVNFFKSYLWFLSVGQNFYLWDYGLLFMGKFLENSERPFYYLPLLQAITTPVSILMTALLGLVLFRNYLKNKIYVLISLAFFINYALYFLLKPVLYDGTRHFMFMVPLVVFYSVLGIRHLCKLFNKKLLGVAILALVLFDLAVVAGLSVRNFPYHYIYFNKLGYLFGNPYHVFESDYSTTLNRKSAEWVRDTYLQESWNLPRKLKVWACDNSLSVDYYSHKKFETVVHRQDADLIICNFRDDLLNKYQGDIIHGEYINGALQNFVLKPESL